MLATYTFCITKRVTVSVLSHSEAAAIEDIQLDIEDGEYTQSFDRAQPEFQLIDMEEL